MYVRVYFTAFTSISSFVVQIELKLFGSPSIDPFYEHSTIDVNVENLKAREILFRVESHVFASEEFESKRR